MLPLNLKLISRRHFVHIVHYDIGIIKHDFLILLLRVLAIETPR
jgi:hypothetical protein